MKSEISISVIIPTFNRASYLNDCIDSVLKQTYCNIEVIVIDDGSTDETEQVLKAYKDKIISSYQDNKGVSSARNKGVSSASGDWLAFLDSDDYWLPNKLESQVKHLLKFSDLKWIHCDEIWIRNGVRVNPKKKHGKQGGQIFKQCLALCCVSPSAVMIEKDFYLANGGFRNDFPVCEDYDLWLKLAKQEPIGFVSDALVIKRGGHEDQLSRFIGLDLYRLEALVWQLENSNLDSNEQTLVRDWVRRRFVILEKGYKKHHKQKELKILYEKYAKFI